MKHIFALFFLICYMSQASVHIGPNMPVHNIEYAFTQGLILPGDTVYLHEGTFYGYQGISKLKGNPKAWIIIKPWANDKIEIAGCWQFMSCEYIKFVGLTFKGNANYPGRLLSVDNSGSCSTQSRHIIVDSCEFSNVTDASAIAGFKFGGVDFFEVRNCYFHDFTAVSTIDFNVCHEGLIRGNRIENCLTGGHIKGGSSDITMEQNLFLNASSGAWVAYELGGDTGDQFYCPGDTFEVKRLNFWSNIIVGGYRGLALSSATECKVINNTFYNCGQATLRFLTTSHLYPKLWGNRVENNIFAFGSSAYINGSAQSPNAAGLKNNIYFGISVNPFAGPYWDSPELDSIKETNPLTYGSDTPMFVDAAQNDYRLKEGSPAIGSGLNMTEPTRDFFGNRFSDSRRSIGAIEAKIQTSVPTSSANQNDVILTPNPASDYIEINVPRWRWGEHHSVMFTVDSQVAVAPVRIFDLLGVEILSNSQLRIDVLSLPPGVYFVQVGSEVRKFVKY